MKVLLIHNDNIPFCLGSDCTSVKFVPPIDNSIHDYDSFVSTELVKLLKDKQYDCIILPFSLSDENYLEYTGLRVAIHIRLTPELNHSRVPILFVGPDTVQEVAKFSELGEFLFTPLAFTTQKKTTEDIDKILTWIENNAKQMTDDEYKAFLDRIHINPPANYATHHSIANEWAVLRWFDMFQWKEGKEGEEGKEPNIHDDFKNMLYFKYLQVKSGQRDHFKKDKKKDPKIDVEFIDKDGTKQNRKPKVVYIDDEYYKGWKDLLEKIFDLSGIDLVCYEKFPTEKKKEELIKEIETFVDNNDADCYLLDLRLHDDDFSKNKDELSGLQIAEYIHKKNEGNQVVIFTASNKVWNLQKAVDEKHGVTDFVVKESPESNCNREESYHMYCEFNNAVKKAIKQSYKKDVVNKLNEIIEKNNDEVLKRHILSFKEIMILNDELTVNSLMLLLLNILVYYCKKEFEITSLGELIRINGKRYPDIIRFGTDKKDPDIDKKNYFRKIIQAKFALSKDGSDVKFYNNLTDCNNIDKGYDLPLDNDKTLVLSVLKYCFNFTSKIEDYLRYTYIRNKDIGHIDQNGIDNKLNIENVKSFFNDVVYKVLITK